MTDFDCVQVTTTTETRDQAAALAREIIGRRLAACAQFDEITSAFWWEGEVQEESEWRLTLKTTKAAVPAAVAAIRELHTYDVPEIIAVPIVGGGSDYLAWIATEVSATGAGNAGAA